MQMFALTVQEPWPWAMLHAGKDVENRGRAPDARLQVGDVFLIHSGKSLDSWQDVQRWDEWPEAMTPMVRFVEDTPLAPGHSNGAAGVPNGGYPACTAVYDGAVLDSSSPWAGHGQVHWKLKDVVPVSNWIKREIGVLRGLPGLFDLAPFHTGLLLGDRSRQLDIFKRTGRFDPASEP